MSYDHENQRYSCPVIDDGPHSDAVFMLAGASDISYAGYACSNCIAKYGATAAAAPPAPAPYVPSPVLGSQPVEAPLPVPPKKAIVAPPAPVVEEALAPAVVPVPAPKVTKKR